MKDRFSILVWCVTLVGLAVLCWLSTDPKGCYPGTLINGVPVDGKTAPEVTVIARQQADALCNTAVTFFVGDRAVRVTPAAIGIKGHQQDGAIIAYYDYRSAAMAAQLRGREASLIERARTRLGLGQHDIAIPVRLVDASRQLPRDLRRLQHPPINAAIRFDGDKGTIVPAHSGVNLDPIPVWTTVANGLSDSKQLIQLPVREVPADITSYDMPQIVRRVHYELPITSPSQDARTNIARMARILDGQIIMPGEALSINRITGRRSLDKGWLMAPTIINRRITKTPAGGVCNTVSTAWGAMGHDPALTTLRRYNHSILPGYCKHCPGQDATVADFTKDLIVKNTSAKPVALHVWVDLRAMKVICETFGEPSDKVAEMRVEKKVDSNNKTVFVTYRLIEGKAVQRFESRYQ